MTERLMEFDEARAILAERNKGNLGPEADWPPDKIGRALRYLHVLANTPHTEWRSKRQIHTALAEFRDSEGASAHKETGATNGRS